MAANSVAEGKSKAKKRYLKRKKERRKNRKAAAPKPSIPAVLHSAVVPSDSDSESSSDEQSSKEDEIIKIPIELSSKSHKRQKTDDIKDTVDEDVSMHVDSTPLDEPPPRAYLPSFPLPELPDAPSPSVLATQGLDRALVDASIVDPATVLPFKPDGSDDSGTGLSEKSRKRLHELGITELFAVQTALLPFLLPPNPLSRSLYLPYDPPRDVCASAPTGSGKTLAYVLPIVEVLSSRIVKRLRALIVLPTRDLVIQVRETFEAVAKGRGLNIGVAVGQTSFTHEQSQLVFDKTTKFHGGSSKVDILICTPGRLIDHLNGTPNFSLQHLRFLIIDEADRLLAQSFQEWLVQVLAATRPPSQTNDTPDTSAYTFSDAMSPAFLQAPFHHDLDDPKISSCQKLMFSATLTRDPGKVAALDLFKPKYFIIQSPTGNQGGFDGMPLGLAAKTFSIPATLSEHMIVCESSQKPLVLFHLVLKHGVINALVFTKSAESSARLVRLFEFFEAARNVKQGTLGAAKVIVKPFSSDSTPQERRATLQMFKKGEIQILVCSDLISRGIDISHVSHVVSYDVPVDMLKYVHRVGRTARAGRTGDAWTLVEEQEARYFKDMLKANDHLTNVKRLRIAAKDLEPMAPYYQAALGSLHDVYGH